MEDQIVEFVKTYPVAVIVLSVLGSLVVLASIIAPFTPTKKDDEALAYAKAHPILSKLLFFVERFSVIPQKKA